MKKRPRIPSDEAKRRGARVGLTVGGVIGFVGLVVGWMMVHRPVVLAPPPAPATTTKEAATPAAPTRPTAFNKSSWSAVTDTPAPAAPRPDEPAVPAPGAAPSPTLPADRSPPPNREPLWRQRARHY